MTDEKISALVRVVILEAAHRLQFYAVINGARKASQRNTNSTGRKSSGENTVLHFPTIQVYLLHRPSERGLRALKVARQALEASGITLILGPVPDGYDSDN